MNRHPRLSLSPLMVGLTALLIAFGLLPLRAVAGGDPLPAGTDTLDVSAQVSVVSLLGSETISLDGTVTIERGDPHDDGGVEVVDMEITAMDLLGTSVTGDIMVSQSPALASTGELRGQQPSPEQFPASSFIDLFMQVGVPASPSPGPLTLHNKEALHLVPMAAGSEVSLTAWPPSGVTYLVEPDPCIPLHPVLPAQVCVTMVSVTFIGPPEPLEGPTISVATGGPSGLHPADLQGMAPTVALAVPCTGLGLTADGCAGQDDVDALSFGADFGQTGVPVTFSVAPGSTGLAGSAVAGQAACSPAQPQADAFSTTANGSNSLIFDGDGLNSGCPAASPFGLQETPNSDDVNALTKEALDFVDDELDRIPDRAVFFSLAAGSPTLGALNRSGADIMWTVGGSIPGVFASSGTLGLQAGDDIDALCVADDGNASYNPAQDQIAFSLTPGSPTLTALGASAADMLTVGPQLLFSANDLGLQAGDDLNAMACGSGIEFPEPLPTPTPTPTPTNTPPPTATDTPTATPTSSAADPTPTPVSTVLGVKALPQVGIGQTADSSSGRISTALAGALAALGLALLGVTAGRFRRT